MGIEPSFPALAGGFFTAELLGKPRVYIRQAAIFFFFFLSLVT